MDEQRQPKRHTQFSRATRGKRILDRLREGWAYDEVAREEGLTERRVRQIVAEYLKDRDAVEGVTHAHMQIDRLGWAMRVAAEAMAEGDVRAIGPFIKAIDRLDRYQELARRTATQAEHFRSRPCGHPVARRADPRRRRARPRGFGGRAQIRRGRRRPRRRTRSPAASLGGRRASFRDWRAAGFFRLSLTVSH